ncbi:MAG TPA: thiamine pyrophosphate-dependent dehydrogenase E1 component subunit alpha [Chthoniobacterales bacterium]
MSASIEPVGVTDKKRETYLAAFRWMLLARLTEDRLSSLWRAGKIVGGVYLGRGQEAFSVALGVALKKGDIFAPLIRDQAGRLAFGESLLDCFRTFLGSRVGPMRGRDGNIHRGRPREGLFAMISHLGGMVSAVGGALLARRFQGDTGVVGATCIGDGGTSTGAFHEAMNMAGIEKLPLVVLVANNQYAYSTPNARTFACDDLVDRARGYGFQGHSVDATNLDECLDKVGRAVSLARSGQGPQLVVGKLLRLSGHAEHDDASYVDSRLKKQTFARDCLPLAEAAILERGWLDEHDLARWRSELLAEIDEAVAIAQEDLPPDASEETWCALATRSLAEGV